MKLKYTPDGAEAQLWDVQLGKLRSHESEAIEKRTGLHYGGDFKEALLKGGMLARRALLFTMLRRTHHTIRFDDVDFADDELELQFDLDEWRRMYAEVEASADLDDEVKAEKLALFAGEIRKFERAAADADTVIEAGGAVTVTEARSGEDLPPEELPGKAPRNNSDAATG
jgi:hypothetical protein